MTSASPRPRPWGRLGWLVLAPLLMAESCPSACGYLVLPIAGAEFALDKASEDKLERAWGMQGKFDGEYWLTPASPAAALDVTLKVEVPAGGSHEPIVVDTLLDVPMVSATACLEDGRPQPRCAGYEQCRTPAGEPVYPRIDGAGWSEAVDVALAFEPGREAAVQRFCVRSYPCSYDDDPNTLRAACLIPRLRLTIAPAQFAPVPGSALLSTRFRVTFTARNPEGAGYGQLLVAGYSVDRGHRVKVDLTALMEGPMMKRKDLVHHRPPATRMWLEVTRVE